MNKKKIRATKLSKDSNLTRSLAILESQMEEVRNNLLKQIEKISEEKIDYSPDEHEIETIGTLLLHIAAVEWSWIFEDIDGREMDYEEWKYAFPLRPSVNIPQLKGKDKRYYLEKLHQVRDNVKKRMYEMTDEDLERTVMSGGDSFTIEWVFHHLIEHESLHLGQIQLLSRLSRLDKIALNAKN